MLLLLLSYMIVPIYLASLAGKEYLQGGGVAGLLRCNL